MSKCVLFIVAVLIGAGSGEGVIFAAPSSLGDRLAQFDDLVASTKGKMSVEEFESQYLELLNTATSDDEKGQVYVSLATLYHTQAPSNLGKIVDYCSKAVALTVPPAAKCRMYYYWAEAYRTRLESAEPEEAPSLRVKTAELYLKGLSLVLANTNETKPIEPPAVGRYRYVGEQADLEIAKQRHDEEIKNRERVLMMNELIKYRQIFIQSCGSLYRMPSSNIEDLKHLLQKYVPDHDEVADEILRQTSN